MSFWVFYGDPRYLDGKVAKIVLFMIFTKKDVLLTDS